MRNVLLTKFGQHPDLADKLLATGDALLIEDSKTDAYWGIGKKGNGQNWLGKCLMDIREMVRKKAEKLDERLVEKQKAREAELIETEDDQGE